MKGEFDKKYFSIRLREIRKSKNLTQEQLCDITGIDVSNYSKMETGKVMPSMSSLYKLITKAGYSPNEMFEYKHIDSEENLDSLLKEMYDRFSFKQKQMLYKIMRSIEENK